MKTLILVDIQNDFTPGGVLAVPEGDQVARVANRLMPYFDHVVATQDWHPADHGSFASQHPGNEVGGVVELAGLKQILWPDHCVQGSHGAELVETLETDRINQIVQKGTYRETDSYSGFFDNGGQHATGLDEYLRQIGTDELYIMGLATDYCVKFTVLDALQLGHDVTLVIDGCRGIDQTPGDVDTAIEEMKSAGAAVCTSDEVIAKIT